MNKTILALFCFALLPCAPAEAACPAPRFAGASLPEPRVETGESMGSITNIDHDSNWFFPMGSVAAGVYISHTAVRVEGNPFAKTLPNGQFEACYDDPKAYSSYAPVIYVAREIAQYSQCLYSEFAEHEMGHHRILRRFAAGPGPSMAVSEAASVFPLAGYGPTEQAALASLQTQTKNFAAAAKSAMAQRAMQAQAEHDSDAEYSRLAFVCNGQLQELLKNTWTGYIYK